MKKFIISFWITLSLMLEHLMFKLGALKYFDFTDMTWNDSLENMGGFTSIAYFAPWQDIEEWPTLPANPTTDEQMVTLEGNFTMKTDKHFIQVYVSPATAELNANNQGETDGQSFRNEGEFFYPGSKVECRAFARKINNSRGVTILIDGDGDRTCIGTEMLPCFFKPTLNYGKVAADRKGLVVQFFQDHFVPGLIYKGSIPLDGSTIPEQS